MEIWIDNTNIKGFGAVPVQLSGYTSALSLKTPDGLDNPGGHGKIYDLTGPRYSERLLSLKVASTAQTHFTDLLALRSLICATIPTRMVIDDGEGAKYYDIVVLRTEFDHPVRCATEMTLEMSEPAPVKRVYKVVGSSASFTTEPVTGVVKQPKLTFSWGDGSFDEERDGLHSHTYTDGKGEHVVIVSGVVEDARIITDHELLYSVLW